MQGFSAVARRADHHISPYAPTGLADGLASVRYAAIKPRLAPGLLGSPAPRAGHPVDSARRNLPANPAHPNRGAPAACAHQELAYKKFFKAVRGLPPSVPEMPRPTSFGKDTGLQIRMTVTMFLLGLVYVALIVTMLAVGANGITVAIIAGGLAALNLFASDKLALAAMGARVVSPQEAPQLHAMVERLCVQADLPKPKVAVANTRMPNAFALGRSPKSATVCATTGIMELLSPAELEGVMAHELTHVANRDVLVMTLAGFFATIAAYIVQFGFFFGGGGSYGDDDDNPSFLVLLLVSLVVYVVSFLLMQALSRYREFAADRGAAIITGRPSALASALQKISSGMHQIPQKDLRAAGELQAFFIFPAAKGSISGVFATHPPMEKRIAALMRLESQLQGQIPA